MPVPELRMNMPPLRERRSYSEGPHLGQVLGSYARHPPPLHSSTLGAPTAPPPSTPVHSTKGVGSLLSPRAAGLGALAGSLGGIGPGFAGGGPAGLTPGGYSGMQLSAVCSDIARQLASWRHSPPAEGPEDALGGGGGELSPRGADARAAGGAGGMGDDSLDGSGHFGAHSGPEQHPAPQRCGGGGGVEGAASDGFVSPPPMLGAKHHEAAALFQGVASPPRLAEVSHHHHHHHGSLAPDAAAAAAAWWHK